MNVTTPTSSPTAKLPQELVESTIFLLKRLGFAAKDRSLAAYEELGLHPYHHAVLLVLDEGSRDTQGSIADALGYDRGQLVGLLDELEEQGLVAR
jgi:DNA-binding MarR family transcriptional regulator